MHTSLFFTIVVMNAVIKGQIDDGITATPLSAVLCEGHIYGALDSANNDLLLT